MLNYSLKRSRLPVSLLASGLSLLALCSVSYAGTWSVGALGKGKCSWQSQGQSGDWNWSGEPGDDTTSITVGNSGIGTTIMAQVQGEISLIIRWTPNPRDNTGGNPLPGNASDTLPASVNVLVTTASTVGGSHDPGGESSFTFSIMPGAPEGDITLKPELRSVGKRLERKKLVKISTEGAVRQSDGSYLKKIPFEAITAKASAQVRRNPAKYDADEGQYYSDGASVNAGVTVVARLDNRSVKLTRNDKDTFKLVDGSWVTYGDSRFSFLKRTLPDANPAESIAGAFGSPLYEDKPQLVKQTIVAAPEGTWSNGLQGKFQWNPSGDGDTSTQHTQEMTQGNSIWNPEGVGQLLLPGLTLPTPSSTVKGAVPSGWIDAEHKNNKLKVFYKKTDTDGATAEASYVLTLHDEWENPSPDNTSFWLEAPNDTPHYGESLSDWIPKPMPLAVGTTASQDDKWKISKTADLNVELKAETSANFGLADWLKFSGSATTKATLGVNTEIEYSITPKECFPNAPSTSSFQPIVRYKVRSKRILLDHYSESGRDINPDRNAPPSQGPLAPPSDGKWPKTGESDILMAEPYWMEVTGDRGPMQISMTEPDGLLPDGLLPESDSQSTSSPSSNYS